MKVAVLLLPLLASAQRAFILPLTRGLTPGTYYGDFTVGSNRDRANLVFTMHSPWTAVAAANCTGCGVRAFNCSQSKTCQQEGDLTSLTMEGRNLTGFTVRDRLCFQKVAEDCVDGLQFFTVTADPSGYFGYFGGVTGVLPGSLNDSDPSLIRFLTANGYAEK